MPALVESMFSVRETPWHGLGTIVQEAPTSADALHLAGLDWEVNREPIIRNGKQVDNYFFNVRNSDNSVLGIVTSKYRVVQNTQAFDFTDSLIGDEVRYETAGSLRNGKTIWLLARLPRTKVVGDDVDPYICFTNSHDGTGAVKVAMTPIRVVCNNTLNLALNNASRTWSTRHTGDIMTKLEEAKRTLEFAQEYMIELNIMGEQYANMSISNAQMSKVLDKLFAVDKDASDRAKANKAKERENYEMCYLAPDIEKFAGTVWGALNAASDFATHTQPTRLTKNYQENTWGKVIDGHSFIDAMQSELMAVVG